MFGFHFNRALELGTKPGAGALTMPLRVAGSIVCAVLAMLSGSTVEGADSLPQAQESRLSRTNLLTYANPRGRRIEVRSPRAWRGARVDIQRRMQEIMGPLPGPETRCPLDMRIESEEWLDGLVRRRITYASEPGGRVPAWLLIPTEALAGRRKHAGVLTLHQTHPLGNKVVVGLGNSPDDEYGLELARRGYVCLAPAYPHLADYAPDLDGLGWKSGTLKAVWDNLRGLDLLESLPFVRRGAFGAIGHSLGGHNALFTAAFDDRIKVVAASCGFDSFLDYYDGNPRVWEPGAGWTQNRYMPRLAGYRDRLAEIPFDFPDVLAALAPRVCFINAPLGDSNFRWRSVDAVVAAVRPVYKLLGKPEHLIVRHPDSPHRFPPELRQEAYVSFDQHLSR